RVCACRDRGASSSERRPSARGSRSTPDSTPRSPPSPVNAAARCSGALVLGLICAQSAPRAGNGGTVHFPPLGPQCSNLAIFALSLGSGPWRSRAQLGGRDQRCSFVQIRSPCPHVCARARLPAVNPNTSSPPIGPSIGKDLPGIENIE